MGGPSHGGGSAPGTSSIFSTLQNLIKPFIGAGILALPSSFKQGGIVASAILMLILGLTAYYCIICLLKCSEHIEVERREQSGAPQPQLTSSTSSEHSQFGRNPNSPTFSLSVDSNQQNSNYQRLETPANQPSNETVSFREVGTYAFGKWGTFSVDLNIVLSQIGFCIAYMSFISQNLNGVPTIDLDNVNRSEWILILSGIWIILCQIRDVKRLSFTSMFGNIVYVIAISVLLYDGSRDYKEPRQPRGDITLLNIAGLPFVFGTGCFALEGIGLILPVKKAMRSDVKHHFESVLKVAVSFVVTCYVLFGSLGYFFYGESVNSIITNNLAAGSLTDAVKIALCISLVFTYVIQMYPVNELSDYMWDTKVFNEQSTSTETNWKREAAVIATRCSFVIFTAVISQVFPNFGLIVSLVGSVSNSAIAFILPQIFYIKILLLPELDRRRLSEGFTQADAQDGLLGSSSESESTCSTWLSDRSDFYRLYHPFFLPCIIIFAGVCASIIGIYTVFA